MIVCYVFNFFYFLFFYFLSLFFIFFVYSNVLFCPASVANKLLYMPELTFSISKWCEMLHCLSVVAELLVINGLLLLRIMQPPLLLYWYYCEFVTRNETYAQYACSDRTGLRTVLRVYSGYPASTSRRLFSLEFSRTMHVDTRSPLTSSASTMKCWRTKNIQIHPMMVWSNFRSLTFF